MTKTVQKLKAEATRQGVSAYRIAKELDVHTQTITRAFNGEKHPSIKLVEGIARVLGLDLKIITKFES